MEAELSAWYRHLQQEPERAVADLLAERRYFAAWNQLQPPELLQMLAAEETAQNFFLPLVDQGLQSLLHRLLQEQDPTASGFNHPKRFARLLTYGFHSSAILPLPQTVSWSKQAILGQGLRRWLDLYYFGRSCDPLNACCVALGRHQSDRQLMSFWLELASIQDGHAHYGQTALNNLLQMPDPGKSGPAGRISEALLIGILRFAEGLQRWQLGSEALDHYLEYLQAAYPMSQQAWQRKWRAAVQHVNMSDSTHQWVARHFPPDIFNASAGEDGAGSLPSRAERERMEKRLQQEPLADLREELQPFFARYRQHARTTGDGYHLVRTFNSCGKHILHSDPLLAVDLAQEAVTWDSHNPHSWSLLGRALDQAGNWQSAEVVFWQARRRFPYNAHSHSQLGSALAERGEREAALAVLDESIRFFPHDEAGYTTKATVLLQSGEGDAAWQVLQPIAATDNVKTLNLLATIQIQRGNLDEAEQVIGRAEQIAPQDEYVRKNQATLRHARQGKKYTPNPDPRPTGRDSAPAWLSSLTGQNFSDAPALGRVTAFRRAARFGAARHHLERVRPGAERENEQGLLLWNERNATEAKAYFAARCEHFPGDGTAQVHYGRACRRSDSAEEVNWAQLQRLFPALESIILTEKGGGKVPRFQLPDLASRLASPEDHRRGWLRSTCEQHADLLDQVQEDVIAAVRA
ncbi:MAG: hypothetical protein HQM06_06950 [Magnetococcales bacterium]|nr:hypothetical protein [Magnetococcales bacterium]